MLNKVVVALVVIAVLAVGGIYFLNPFGNGDELRLPGVVEIQEVRLGSKVGGRVSKILVKEGARVKPGDPLVVFEVPEWETKRDQLKAQVLLAEAELQRALKGSRVAETNAALASAKAAKARYDRMEKGWREEEKRQALSELESAQAEFKQARDELDRANELFRNRSISRAEFDLAVSVNDRTKGRANAAKAKMDLISAGNRQEDKDEASADWQKAQAYADQIAKSRNEEIAMNQAKLADAQAKLTEVEVNLKEAVVAVPLELGEAIVEVLAVRPGDLVPAGQAVVRVLRVEDLWVKVFVPETELGKVELNSEVEVTIDSARGKRFKGIVIQRSSISEFTPRNVQSVDERRYQMFGVKIRVDDAQGILNAGMAAQVVFRRTSGR